MQARVQTHAKTGANVRARTHTPAETLGLAHCGGVATARRGGQGDAGRAEGLAS